LRTLFTSRVKDDDDEEM
jgi:hypothetical protein